MSTSRLEAFSDGVMAIIITIVVLEIPLPEQINFESMVSFLYTIFIFFVTFIIVGTQWVKHHFIFDKCNKVNNKILWQNIIYLFFISLLPLFTKWIMENPNEMIPALSYNLINFAIVISFNTLSKSAMLANEELVEIFKSRMEQRNLKDGKYRKRPSRLVFLIGFLAFIVLISVFIPSLTIFFFIVLPIAFSLFNLWADANFFMRPHDKQDKE